MDPIDRAGKYAALLTITENGLGALLHVYRLPLSGHFLSLNQGFLLTRFVEQSRDASPRLPFLISMIAATLKSLAPVGKRLTPMLAISVQGLLFSFGVFVFGMNVYGALLGMLLLTIWAFVQPALIYYLIFGHEIIEVAQYYLKELKPFIALELEHVLWGVSGLIFIKMFMGIVLVVLSFSSQKIALEYRALSLGEKFKPTPNLLAAESLSRGGRLRAVAGDLLRPWFLISLALCFLFFILSDAQSIHAVWYTLRTLAVAIVIFYTLRYLPVDRWLLKVTTQNSNAQRILVAALAAIK